MRYFFTFGFLSLLLAGLPAAAQTAPADTVRGQARVVQLLAATLCTRIEEAGRTRPFEQLTAQEADALFTNLMVTGMSEQADAFMALMSEGEKRNLTSHELGQRVGRATVLRLSTSCPGSMALVMRTSAAQREAGAHAKSMNNISAEEKVLLQPMADSACAQLAVRDAREPLRNLSPAARKQEMGRVLQTLMLKNMPALLKLYSLEQIGDQAKMEMIGIKLASLMMTQCPTYLIMLGQDVMNERAAAKAAPKPTPKRARKPAAKASPKSQKK